MVVYHPPIRYLRYYRMALAVQSRPRHQFPTARSSVGSAPTGHQGEQMARRCRAGQAGSSPSSQFCWMTVEDEGWPSYRLRHRLRLVLLRRRMLRSLWLWSGLSCGRSAHSKSRIPDKWDGGGPRPQKKLESLRSRNFSHP